MDTVPLPAVPADGPQPGRGAGVAARTVITAAGVASGGLLVIGAALVVLQLIARDIAPGTGVAAAAGPTWPRALAQLAVGLAGEGVVRARRWMGAAARVWMSVGVLAATAVVLWLCWWR